jgi:hypothetical protein
MTGHAVVIAGGGSTLHDLREPLCSNGDDLRSRGEQLVMPLGFLTRICGDAITARLSFLKPQELPGRVQEPLPH